MSGSSTQVLTTGILIGLAVGATLTLTCVQVPRWIRAWNEKRAVRWTDNDVNEIEEWEQYVSGTQTPTSELPIIKAEPVWVRPVEEHGALIPQWRAEIPPPPSPYRGPPFWDLRNWAVWHMGDLLPDIGAIYDVKKPGRHRLVPHTREAAVWGP